MRGAARLIRIQSSTVGGFKPAAAAIAGVQQKIRGSAKRGMNEHRVFHGGRGEYLTDRHAQNVQTLEGGRGAAGEFQPDRFARRRERAVRQRHAERFRNDLRRGGRARETDIRRLTIHMRGPWWPRSRD